MEHFKAGCIFLIVHQFGPFYIKIKCFIKNKSQMIFSKSESRETNWNLVKHLDLCDTKLTQICFEKTRKVDFLDI